MKTIRLLIVIVALLLWASEGSAQLGNLKSLGKKVLDKAAPASEKAGANSGQGESATPLEKAADAVLPGGGSSVAGAGEASGVISTDPGSVVFASSPIDPASPSGLKTAFTAGEPLHGLAFLPQTLKQLYTNAGPNEKLQVEVFVYTVKPPLYSYQKEPRMEQLIFYNMYVSGDLKDRNYLVLDMVPDPATTQVYNTPGLTWKKFGAKYEGPVALAEALARLEPGDNTLQVEIHAYYSKVASGTLTLSGSDFSAYNAFAEKLNETALQAGAANAEFPAAVTSDPPREARMVAALKNSNDWKTGFIDGTEVLKTAITYDWEIRRHEISGAILHRYCIAAIAFKTKSGGCAYRKVTFQEDYVGGKFQPLRYDGVGDKVMMDCAKVK